VSGCILALDLITKRWAAQTFDGRPQTIIDPVLTFTYAENAGSAFNLIEGGVILGLAAIVAVGIVIGAVWAPRPTVEVIGFALIGGGAMGNLADRLFRGGGVLDGRVIDWIQFPNFPVFNIADSALTIGVAILILAAWLRPEETDG
jgi:signal peptidase II